MPQRHTTPSPMLISDGGRAGGHTVFYVTPPPPLPPTPTLETALLLTVELDPSVTSGATCVLAL